MWWNDRPRMARDIVDGDPHPHLANSDNKLHPGDEVVVVGGDREPPSWSSVDPALFFGIRDQLLAEWALQLGVPVSRLPVTAGEASRVLNQFGESFRDRTGELPENFIDVQNDPEVWTRLARRGNNSDILPPLFQVETPQGRVIFRNTIDSVRPMQITEEEALGPPSSSSRFDVGFGANESQRDPALSEEGRTSALRILGGPVIDPAVLANLMGQTATTTSGSGGGRGTLRFDRDQLAEGIRERWRTILREDPSNLGGLVSEFEAAANSMWKAGGAQKDFDTWVLNRMKGTPQYRRLYGRKDPQQSEVEYLQGFLSAEQFGLDPRIANREVVRGLSTGAAPASFAESVAFSRDVQALGQGSFSRRFANLINQLGPLQSA